MSSVLSFALDASHPAATKADLNEGVAPFSATVLL